MTDRYQGKPFLRLLDAYVLDAIGHLDAATQEGLVAAEPELRQSYGLQGGWRDIVVARMNFPEGMAGAICEVWEKGRVRFVAANGHEPDPSAFARTFIDSKFPH